MKLSRSQTGAVAEAEITAAAMRLGVVVLRPMSEGLRYDLIFDLRPRLLRVQCKWAVREGAIVRARLSTSRHTPRNGYVRTTYSAEEIDAFALYCASLHRCFLVPIRDVVGRTFIHLRLAPARNNQQLRINLAQDYDLAKMVGDLGL